MQALQAINQFGNQVESVPGFGIATTLYQNEMAEHFTKDPFYEKVPKKNRPGEFEEIRRRPPQYITEEQRILWKKIMKRAWYHDRNFCGCTPIDCGCGMVTIISSIPIVGSIVAYRMHYTMISMCHQAGCPPKLLAAMGGNATLDFLMTLVPLLGTLLSWMKASSTRNAGLFDKWLRGESEKHRQLLVKQKIEQERLMRPQNAATPQSTRTAPQKYQRAPQGPQGPQERPPQGRPQAQYAPNAQARPPNAQARPPQPPNAQARAPQPQGRPPQPQARAPQPPNAQARPPQPQARAPQPQARPPQVPNAQVRPPQPQARAPQPQVRPPQPQVRPPQPPATQQRSLQTPASPPRAAPKRKPVGQSNPQTNPTAYNAYTGAYSGYTAHQGNYGGYAAYQAPVHTGGSYPAAPIPGQAPPPPYNYNFYQAPSSGAGYGGVRKYPPAGTYYNVHQDP